jgi:hypothetical protein
MGDFFPGSLTGGRFCGGGSMGGPLRSFGGSRRGASAACNRRFLLAFKISGTAVDLLRTRPRWTE